MEGIEEAKRLFEESPIRDVFTRTAMVSGYVQNGNIAQARNLFERMPQLDCVSWAAIIAGYAQTGHYEDVLHILLEKKRDGETINRVAFSCALSTCADLAALQLGKQVHGQAVKAGYKTGCFVGNALLGIC